MPANQHTRDPSACELPCVGVAHLIIHASHVVTELLLMAIIGPPAFLSPAVQGLCHPMSSHSIIPPVICGAAL